MFDCNLGEALLAVKQPLKSVTRVLLILCRLNVPYNILLAAHFIHSYEADIILNNYFLRFILAG